MATQTPYQDTYRQKAAATLAPSRPGAQPLGPQMPANTGTPPRPTGGPAAAPPRPPAPAPALPPIQSVTNAPAPNSDPIFAAFIRGLGAQEGSAWRNAALQLSQGASNRDVRLEDLQTALGDRNRNIDLGYESRGFGRSGMEVKDLGFARRDYNRDVGDTQRQWAQSQALIRQQLQDQIAALARQRADAELDLLQRNEARKAAGISTAGTTAKTKTAGGS